MFVDLTQKIIQGFTYREGSPALTIENKKCFETLNGEKKEYVTAVFSCACHNMGTHIDTIMPVEIPLKKLVARGVKYDLSNIGKDIIDLNDIDISKVEEGFFVFFQTDWDKYLYEDKYYEHPEIDLEVINALIQKKVNMVGIDTMGLGKGNNHGIIDRLLAKNQIYAIENLTNLNALPEENFTVYCFPLKIEGVEAHPARIIAEY